MVTLEEATVIAQHMVQQRQIELNEELCMQRTERLDSERLWVFSYNTVAFLESRNPRVGLVGNGPIVVDKSTGVAYRVPTGGMKTWLDIYNLTGQPPIRK